MNQEASCRLDNPRSEPSPDHPAHHPTEHHADRFGDLIERCATGDEWAFAELYDATAPRAYGLAVRVLRSRALAEEVTQDAFLELWRQSSRYDRSRGNAVAWLLTLVHRRAVDRVRSVHAARRREDAHHRLALAGSDADGTSTTALDSLEAKQVRAALARLAPPQRQAISLAYFDGLTHVEVAAAVGAPLGTVKYRIRAGLRALSVVLATTRAEAT